jgi:hypothetical protein
MKCEHDSYENTGNEAHVCDKSQTYSYMEMKCDICPELVYEKYLYLGTYEKNEIPKSLFKEIKK